MLGERKGFAGLRTVLMCVHGTQTAEIPTKTRERLGTRAACRNRRLHSGLGARPVPQNWLRVQSLSK
jgi:hypothetical protein